MKFQSNATVVLVCMGPWADGSSWNNVILQLEAEGLNVVRVSLPLTSLGDDATALKRVIGRTTGPVLLARARLCGAVIAASTRVPRERSGLYRREDGERMKAKQSPRSSTRTSLTHRLRRWARTRTALFGCRTRIFRTRFHRTSCHQGANRSLQSRTTAYLSQVHSATSSYQASLEIKASMVPRC